MSPISQQATSLTVESLEVVPVLVPMPEPHRTASGVVSACPLALVRLRTREGVEGESFVFTYTPAALKPTAELIRNLESMIKGRTLAPARLFEWLHSRFRLLGGKGLVGIAISAIDMALWDALARRAELPLCRLLGSEPQEVKAYGAVGFDGVEGSAKSAADWARKGLKGIKAKIGYSSVAEDLDVIRAMRSATGHDMAIMVDYNQSLTPAEASARLRKLDEEGLTWVEEPTLADDFEGHARIAQQAATPIQCGENWWGTSEVQQAIDAGASDYVMLDAMKIGGVTGWMRASAMCAAKQLPVSSHLWPEWSAQMLSASATAHWLEYADWWNPIVKDPLELRNGSAVTSAVAGSGLQIDWEAARRFAA
jgi:mandelate racemase